MSTSTIELSKPTKERFHQSTRILQRLDPILSQEEIRVLETPLRPGKQSAEGSAGAPPTSASWDVVQRIRAARIARGWTQKELAERAGIERANLARLEAGKHSPRVDTLESLAKCLELSLAELFETAHEAAEMRALGLRQLRAGVQRLKENLKVQRRMGIIDASGRRTKRELPDEMLNGTSEAV